MAAQSDFVADAAHRLRHPVAGVLALAEAVARAPDAGAARARAGALAEAARETAALTEALLLLERASAGGAASRPETVDLERLPHDRIEAFAAPRGVDVTLDAGATGALDCDPVMLGEAITNLLDNAARHAGPKLSRIDVRAMRVDRTVRIAVSDDGAGVPPDALPLPTGRFHQVRPGRGSGLGLSLTVAEAHGGTLSVRNDAGLTVEIALPAPRVPRDALGDADGNAVSGPGSDGGMGAVRQARGC